LSAAAMIAIMIAPAAISTREQKQYNNYNPDAVAIVKKIIKAHFCHLAYCHLRYPMSTMA
jgi:hypothetical protein